VALLGTSVLSALGSGAGPLGAWLRLLVLAASVVLNAGAFIVGFRVATARHLSVRDVAPGAIAAAVIWQLLQTFGAAYVGRVVKSSSDTNGVFALVLGLIAFMSSRRSRSCCAWRPTSCGSSGSTPGRCSPR